MRKLDDYRIIAGDRIIDEILREAEPLKGKYVTHVNSTYYGGGVAEILDNLVYLMNEVGINAGWRLLKGSDGFFEITKFFHNGCQGAAVELTPEIRKKYEENNERNAKIMHLEKSDAVIAHDPQVLPLIRYYEKSQPWIWRCHIDITNPDKILWEYLKGFINRYDAMVISDERFRKKDINIPQHVIMPSIDPLADKNRDLSAGEAEKILAEAGINTGKPIISQISRYDHWKDPLGVIDAFLIVKREINCQLILLGNFADDDPEGQAMFDKVKEKAKDLGDVMVLANMDNNDLLVNALQRSSVVVLQKSLREGFGLTVSEALWKGTPVVAGRVGGISNQIIDGQNGFLVASIEECAQRTIGILKDGILREKMGRFARDFVKEHFLITRHLLDYIRLIKAKLN